MLADARAQAALVEGWLWFGGILIAVLVGVAIVASIRKKVRNASGMREPEFSLDQLRDLRDRGELTKPQYEALRQRIVETSKRYGT